MRFVDTNVLLYSPDLEPAQPAKAASATQILTCADLVLSVQVLQGVLRACLKRVHASGVAQVSKPAVSPTSKSAARRKSRAPWNHASLAGLETRDTADLEVCATAAAPPVCFFRQALRGRLKTQMACHPERSGGGKAGVAQSKDPVEFPATSPDIPRGPSTAFRPAFARTELRSG